MARTNIPITSLDPNGNVAISFTSGDSANDHDFDNDGRTILLAVQGATGTPSVTVVSVADAIGRTGDVVQAMSTNQTRVFGPFTPKSAWNQSNGRVNLDLDTGTNFTIAAIRLP